MLQISKNIHVSLYFFSTSFSFLRSQQNLIVSGRFSDLQYIYLTFNPPENAILAFGNGSNFRPGARGEAGGSITGQGGRPRVATEQQQGPQATTGGGSISTDPETSTLRAQIPAQVSN